MLLEFIESPAHIAWLQIGKERTKKIIECELHRVERLVATAG
ncbi:hypothetical protein [Dactylosporangium sp. NPDC051484]